MKFLQIKKPDIRFINPDHIVEVTINWEDEPLLVLCLSNSKIIQVWKSDLCEFGKELFFGAGTDSNIADEEVSSRLKEVSAFLKSGKASELKNDKIYKVEEFHSPFRVREIRKSEIRAVRHFLAYPGCAMIYFHDDSKLRVWIDRSCNKFYKDYCQKT